MKTDVKRRRTGIDLENNKNEICKLEIDNDISIKMKEIISKMNNKQNA